MRRGRRRGAAASASPIAAWSASPAGPVAAFALPRGRRRPPARSRPPRRPPPVACRFARDSRTGAAAKRLGVNTAAAGDRAAVGDDQREVRPAGRLDPGRRARRREARRDARRALDRRAGRRERREQRSVASGIGGPRAVAARVRARAAAERGPAVSGRPWTTLNAWIAWPAAPLTRLSMTPMARTRPVRSSTPARRRGTRCCPGRAWWRAASSTTVTNGSSRVGLARRARRARPGVTGRVGRTWQADRMPAGHRDEVGQEVDAARRPGWRPAPATERASSCSISPTWRWREDAVRLDALVDLAEVEVRLGVPAGARDAALGVHHEVAR